MSSPTGSESDVNNHGAELKRQPNSLTSDRERLYSLFRAVWNNIESPPDEIVEEMNTAAEALDLDCRYVRNDQ